MCAAIDNVSLVDTRKSTPPAVAAEVMASSTDGMTFNLLPHVLVSSPADDGQFLRQEIQAFVQELASTNRISAVLEMEVEINIVYTPTP